MIQLVLLLIARSLHDFEAIAIAERPPARRCDCATFHDFDIELALELDGVSELEMWDEYSLASLATRQRAPRDEAMPAARGEGLTLRHYG